MAERGGARRAQPGRVPNGTNYHTHALTRGLGILGLLGRSRGPLTLQELHRGSGLPKSTLVRLLSALSDEGYAVRVDERPAYRLGHKVLALARSYVSALDVTELARPYLREVAKATGHTSNLGVLDGHDVLHVALEHAERPLRFDSRVGERARTYCTGLGKMLLSGLADKDVPEHLPPKLERLTGATITTRAALLRELAVVRERGFSTDDSAHSPGLSCVAVPVVVEGSQLAAMSVSGPSGEFDDNARAAYVRVLRSAAESLAADGTAIDLHLVETPSYIQAGREDHIAPPESVWRLTTQFSGPMSFVLAGSGHIAGVVNPPLARKYQYWTNDAAADTLDAFLEGATEHPGSWWSDWFGWLEAIDGARVKATGKRKPGGHGDKVIEDAPGRYVAMR